jgi:DNA-binding SARP family transcriptional activator
VGGIVFSQTGYREGDRDELFAALMRAFDEAAPGDSVVAEARRLNDEANAFMREGKPGYALFFQERIRELLPDYPSVHLRIAEAALADGRREQALESLVRYLAEDPQTYDSAAVRRMISGLSAPGR